MPTATATDIQIRQSQNASTLAFLDSAIFKGDEPIKPNAGVWWVADAHGASIGFCGIRKLSYSVAFLERAGVMPGYRGRGIHDRMIKLRLRWARKHGVKTVITYTLKDNHASSNNLARNGFALYEPDWAWVGREVLYWMRNL